MLGRENVGLQQATARLAALVERKLSQEGAGARLLQTHASPPLSPAAVKAQTGPSQDTCSDWWRPQGGSAAQHGPPPPLTADTAAEALRRFCLAMEEALAPGDGGGAAGVRATFRILHPGHCGGQTGGCTEGA